MDREHTGVRVFFSYSHDDKVYRDRIHKHLGVLEHQNFIECWWDGEIEPGAAWHEEIVARLNSADLIVILVSASFLASEFCHIEEMNRALVRHDCGEARIIPVLVRSCLWDSSPLRKLQFLPDGRRPLAELGKQKLDRALTDIARNIAEAVTSFKAKVLSNSCYQQLTLGAPPEDTKKSTARWRIKIETVLDDYQQVEALLRRVNEVGSDSHVQFEQVTYSSSVVTFRSAPSCWQQIDQYHSEGQISQLVGHYVSDAAALGSRQGIVLHTGAGEEGIEGSVISVDLKECRIAVSKRLPDVEDFGSFPTLLREFDCADMVIFDTDAADAAIVDRFVGYVRSSRYSRNRSVPWYCIVGFGNDDRDQIFLVLHADGRVRELQGTASGGLIAGSVEEFLAAFLSGSASRGRPGDGEAGGPMAASGGRSASSEGFAHASDEDLESLDIPEMSARPARAGRRLREPAAPRSGSPPPIGNATAGAPHPAVNSSPAAMALQGILAELGVPGRIVDVVHGPVVTRYLMDPEPNTVRSQVIRLADEIGRILKASPVRVSAPSDREPVSIEVPNESREVKSFVAISSAKGYGPEFDKLPLILGRDISGQLMAVDLADCPQLLIAGTDPAETTMVTHAAILSLVSRLAADRLRLILIDPLKTGLEVYGRIPHLLTPVLTDQKTSSAAIRWIEHQVRYRAEIVSQLGMRNIESYNTYLSVTKVEGPHVTRKVQTGFDRSTGFPVYDEQIIGPSSPLPLIVVILCEPSGLMNIAHSSMVDMTHAIAQDGRATGIHLVMSTRRPSIDANTGMVKTYFKNRICLRMASGLDSYTMLGEPSAEKLLGQGDMLFKNSSGAITRVHGPVVSEEEIAQTVRRLREQGEPAYLGEVIREIYDGFGNA